jgi:hypothetical protein
MIVIFFDYHEFILFGLWGQMEMGCVGISKNTPVGKSVSRRISNGSPIDG